MARYVKEDNSNPTLKYRAPTPTRADSSGYYRSPAKHSGEVTSLSALKIPRPSGRGRASSSGSPRYDASYGDGKPSPDDHSPASAHSLSPLGPEDDGFSFYQSVDRGYTAALKIYETQAMEKSKDRSEDSTTTLEQQSSPCSLAKQLRTSLQSYGGQNGGKKWLPIKKLFELVTESQATNELSLAFEGHDLSGVDLRSCARDICRTRTYEGPDEEELSTSCRSIFAILVLLEKTREMLAFLDASISDRDLPFLLTKDGKLCKFSDPGSPLLVTQNWTENDVVLVGIYQNYLLSPFFELRTNEVPFLSLERDIVLPFIEDYSKSRRKEGHHGAVYPVKIHPSHHDLGEERCVAVKELNYTDNKGIDFKNEVTGWRKSAGVAGHPHLIRLLATWRQNDSWFLLFPLAKGNLSDYWEKNMSSSREAPLGNLSLAKWVTRQCLGIAEGLKKIHRIGSDELEFQSWGIHGDIKPENILWFTDPDDENGKLVICDFGFTRFHGKETRSAARPVGQSPTYRAPEYDIKGIISRKYDTWTLGCLYLEFITWYLVGPKGVWDTFANKRSAEDRGEPLYQTDKFWNPVRTIDGKYEFGAIVKPCVKEWIQYLRSRSNCSNLFHKFLDLVENNLLVVNPDDRCDCSGVVRKLGRMCDKLEKEGESFALVGQPKSKTLAGPAENKPVPFPYPEEAKRKYTESEYKVTFADDTWCSVNSEWSSESQTRRKQFPDISKSFSASPTQIGPWLPSADTDYRDFGIINDQTPLLHGQRTLHPRRTTTMTPPSNSRRPPEHSRRFIPTPSPLPLTKHRVGRIDEAINGNDEQQAATNDDTNEEGMPAPVRPQTVHTQQAHAPSEAPRDEGLPDQTHQEVGSDPIGSKQLLESPKSWLSRWGCCWKARTKSNPQHT